MELDDSARARLARGWASSCLTKSEYAARHGISERTLRSYIQRFGVGTRPDARARAIIERALRELQDLLAALDAEAARQDGGPDGEVDAVVPERQATSAPATVSAAADSPAAAPQPVPMPVPGFLSW